MYKLLEVALQEYGIKEILGEVHTQRIVDYAKEAGFEWVNDDETPWCSIFVNWVALKAGYERTKLANARSWLDIGFEVTDPKLGDVVIFQRGNSEWQGHVAFYINQDAHYIYVLGGNQSNQVMISPYKKEQLIGYRRLHPIE